MVFSEACLGGCEGCVCCQVISNMLDFGMEPQMALDAPRFSVYGVDSAEGPCTVRESRSALQPVVSMTL